LRGFEVALVFAKETALKTARLGMLAGAGLLKTQGLFNGEWLGAAAARAHFAVDVAKQMVGHSRLCNQRIGRPQRHVGIRPEREPL